MSETIKSVLISRRKAILLLGSGVAFTLADWPEGQPALAQQAAPATGGAAGAPATAATPAAPATRGTKGMQRRKARRAGGHERRAKRRGKEPAGTATPSHPLGAGLNSCRGCELLVGGEAPSGPAGPHIR